jgi:DNA-binding HxlR family transcriptional regulator
MHESATQTATNSDPTNTDRGIDCSSRFLLDQIADKWSVLILAALCKKPLRFNELKRCLDGITQKALTQALRRLERNGILGRRVIPSSQVAVEYSITPLGRTLEHPFSALYLWTLEHLDTVIKAQATFDSREIEAGQA